MDTTERLHFHFSFSCIGEGNGNPLQCSCLENPRDGGTCWAAVYGVAQSQTRLKRLSSSSRQLFGLRDRQLRSSPRAAETGGRRVNPEMTLVRSERRNPKMGCRREVKRGEERMVPARDKIWPVNEILRSQGRVSPATFCGSGKSADCVPVAVSGLCTSTVLSHHQGTRQDCVLHAFEALHGHVTDCGQ